MRLAQDGFFVCFGESLLRLSAPPGEMLLQSARLDVNVGGAELNVAVLLARLGRRARLASVLPDNDLAETVLATLRQHGVDTSAIRRVAGRMGLYFMTPGAVLRAADIIYDRAGSAFALAAPDAIDWDAALDGAIRLHLTGITPATGPNGAAAALRAAGAAQARGVPVSFDGNYRAKMWQAWDGDAPAVLRQLVAAADIAFLDRRDLALILGTRFDTTPDRAVADAAFAAFPTLTHLAWTRRVQHNVTDHDLTAFLATRDRLIETPPQRLRGIVDRIGTGDAFVAALLDQLHGSADSETALAFALSAACLKHSMAGDLTLANRAEIARGVGGALDVRR